MEKTVRKQRNTRKPKEQRVIRQFFDKDENVIQIESTDKRTYIYLKLKKDNRKRELGVITKSTRTFFVKRDKPEHYHVKIGGYGFNHYILNDAKTFDFVNLTTVTDNYKIPRQFMLDNVKIYHFKNSSDGEFELQIFLTTEQLAEYKIKLNENRRF